MINTGKFKERMTSLGITQKEIAKALSISGSTVSLKLRNQRPFFLNEVKLVSELLKIQDSEFSEFFLQ